MCGINGYFSPSKKFVPHHIDVMNNAMAHRGPDAQGVFTDNVVGLGHLRLSILDLSEHANQPMASTSCRYQIIFNGEVYNFKEVKNEINKIKPGLVFKTTSDTEVLLEAFEIWGPEMINRFNGMFALAIYDTKEHELFLFRDRLGKKPIYYYWNGADFIFSSELKALKKIDSLKFTVDKEAINLFLHLGYIPQPHSIYNEVKKFPSGSYAIIKEKSFEIKTFWEASSTINSEILSDEVEAKKQLQNLLISSVEYRLISDVPFGTFLSGGVDSSLVTGIAQSITTLPVKTFSIGFKDSEKNESGYARAVSNHLKTNHTEFTVTENEAKAIVPSLMSIYDEPYADPSAIPTLMVSELARKQVTMTLSGDGGDELFMGYGVYNWANKLQNSWLKYFHNPVSIALSFGNNRQKRVAELLKYSNKVNFQSHIFSQEQYFFSKTEIKLLLKTNMYSFKDIEYPHANKRPLSAAEEQALFDLNYYLKDDLLVKVDRATMHHSLETRVPLLDYRIVEFALNLDENLKNKNGVQKYLLKQILYDYVPKEIFDRPKWGFGIPLHSWLKTDLKFLIDKYLSKSVVEQYGVVQFEMVDYYIKGFFNDKEYYYNRIWVLIILHQWLSEID